MIRIDKMHTIYNDELPSLINPNMLKLLDFLQEEDEYSANILLEQIGALYVRAMREKLKEKEYA